MPPPLPSPREGRASLVTSFSLFKFMALYCIAEFVTVAVLYSVSIYSGWVRVDYFLSCDPLPAYRLNQILVTSSICLSTSF